MYRRQSSCVLAEIFSYGSKTVSDASEVLQLPRSVADELVVASILGLFALTDVSVPYSDRVFATDASMSKGAFTSRVIGEECSELVWLGGDKKGTYTLLDGHARQQLRSLGVDVDDVPTHLDFNKPEKSLGFFFDSVEICGGSGVLSQAMCDQGMIVCTPIDLSKSSHYDVTDLKLVEWVFQMIAEKRFRSIIVEPVCRTFSPAQHPASRSGGFVVQSQRLCWEM